MDTPSQQNNKPEEKEQANKESLKDIRKRLETGQEIQPDSLKEMKARNLAQTRDTLNDGRSDTIINVEQGKGVININTGSVGNSDNVKKSIPTDFFLKQRGLSSSNIQHRGGRL